MNLNLVLFRLPSVKLLYYFHGKLQNLGDDMASLPLISRQLFLARCPRNEEHPLKGTSSFLEEVSPQGLCQSLFISVKKKKKKSGEIAQGMKDLFWPINVSIDSTVSGFCRVRQKITAWWIGGQQSKRTELRHMGGDRRERRKLGGSRGGRGGDSGGRREAMNLFLSPPQLSNLN